jgi:outer membrane receptor protein involved in Fe transport
MLEANFKARARICEGLYADLGYNYARYTKADGERIKEMHNLNLAVNYRFHKQFSAYIQGDNLLNRNYFSYAGYIARGTNVLLGLEYRF